VVDEEVDRVEGDVRALAGRDRRLAHPRDGVAEDLLALHLDQRALARDGQQRGACAVRPEDDRPDAARSVDAAQQRGAGAVAEQRGRPAVFVIRESG
jgi:hypothetical protein